MWRPRLAPPPASTFRFASTLRLASIGKCRLPDSAVQGLHFPQLKHLALHGVSVSECSLHGMIARCPALECLLIHYSYGFHCARINSGTLRSIGVHLPAGLNRQGLTQFKQLVLENAPRLERLLRLDLLDGLQVSLISAPKLETLGFLRSRNRCISTIIQGLRDDSLTTVLHTVKTLAVNMSTFSLDSIIDLMECFPCLEKLYIQNESRRVLESPASNFGRHERQNLIGSPDIHIKTIVLESYQAIVSEVNFATFFVLNARVLELMIIQVETNDEEFIAKQQGLLQLENRASRGARFHFTTHRCIRDVSDISHVRDLDLTDPFVCRRC